METKNIKEPVVLIYKRTHEGDPEKGIFGINNCMNSVRDWEFDAVIGIGGSSPWIEDINIAKKINWIGIGAKKNKVSCYKNKVITFEKICLFDEEAGTYLEKIAPKLYKHLFVEEKARYRRRVKSTSLSNELKYEVLQILKIIENCPNVKSYNYNENDIEKIVCKSKFNDIEKKGGCKTC